MGANINAVNWNKVPLRRRSSKVELSLLKKHIAEELVTEKKLSDFQLAMGPKINAVKWN